MLRKIFTLNILVVFVACSGNRSDQDLITAAIEYDNSVRVHVSEMQHLILNMQEQESDSVLFSEGFKKQTHVMDSLIKSLAKLPKFKGSSAYRDAALRLAGVYKRTTATYFPQIATLYKNAKLTTTDSAVLQPKRVKKDSTGDSASVKLANKPIKKEPSVDSTAAKLILQLRREETVADSLFLKEKTEFAKKYKFPELE